MWKEYSRRCDSDAEDSLVADPSEVMVFAAEIAGEQDGETLFCTTCWAPFMPELYAFEVTRESLYDYLVNLELEDGGELERIRSDSVLRVETDEEYEGPFAEQFRQMVRMIADCAGEMGFRTESYDDSDDLDDL